MLLAGDELYRTQNGNNNAYCQDNSTSWIDWSLLDKHKDITSFTIRAIAFRKEHPCLRRTSFLNGNTQEDSESDIHWYGHDGQPPDWDRGPVLGCLMNGHSRFTGANENKDHLLMLFNASDKRMSFSLPAAPGEPWSMGLTTEENEPLVDRESGSITIDSRSVNVLISSGNNDS